MGGVFDLRQYAAVLENVPVSILVFDTDLTMVHANAAYLAAVGLGMDEVVGQNVFDVFVDDPDSPFSQVESLRSIMRRAVQTGRTQSEREFRYDLPSATGGFERHVWDLIEVPVPGPDGRPEFVVHYAEDVTEAVDAREARERSDRVADELRERMAAAREVLRARNVELELLNDGLEIAAAHDRALAEVLQRALLADLVVPPGIRLDALYRSAADRVGGDWYDLVELPHHTLVVVGDVAGHDIAAAAAMGQLRAMLRTLAWADRGSPAVLLSRLDRCLVDLHVDTMATLVVAAFAPSSADGCIELTWASAGHPPPLVLSPDGAAHYLVPDEQDVFLGVDAEAGRHDFRTSLPAGSQVLLYTDGLIERRGEPIQVGLDRLCEVVVACGKQLGAEAPLADLLAPLLQDRLGDDAAAVLVGVVAADPTATSA